MLSNVVLIFFYYTCTVNESQVKDFLLQLGPQGKMLLNHR